jgi:hypothetical protein
LFSLPCGCAFLADRLAHLLGPVFVLADEEPSSSLRSPLSLGFMPIFFAFSSGPCFHSGARLMSFQRTAEPA